MEAPRLREIYRNSICTLAATAAKSGRDGLFRPQNAIALSPCVATIGNVRCFRRLRHIDYILPFHFFGYLGFFRSLRYLRYFQQFVDPLSSYRCKHQLITE
jgi:hypothetical protein